MRIGIFTDAYTPDINGVVSSIVTLQKELERNGHVVFIISNHKAMTMKREGNVLRLPGLELKWLYGYKLSTPFHFNARDEIAKMNLDVIHVHTEFGVGTFGRIVAKYLNIPVVTTYHTMYEDYTHYVNFFNLEEIDKVSKKAVSLFSRTISDSAQAVIAPSDKTKEKLLDYGVKTPIYVIPTGICFDQFDAERIDQEKVKEIRHQYGIADDDHVVTYVGRIAQEKSIEIPIEGFRFIHDEKIKLFIVGGGPQLKELRELVKKYHLENQVIFTDRKSPEEIPLYYACADCFVSASLSETQGMTYIEALACSLPVFARPDEVLENLVVEGYSGYLFHTPEEFAQKLMAYFALSKEEQDLMHDHAREKSLRYDSRIFYQKVLSVYYQAIDDFEDAYEVTKIKTLDDYVRISVTNDSEKQPIKILVGLDDFFLYKIRLHTRLDRRTVAEFQRKEIILEAYRGAIRKLRMRDYTRWEMKKYLQSIHGLSKEDVESLLYELEEKGYINDQLYLEEKMEKLQFAPMSKGKMRRTLINKGLDEEMIDEALKKVNDEDEREKAKKMAEKLWPSLRDKSNQMRKQTIIRKLVSQGFDSNIVHEAVNQLEYDEDETYALEKTIQKSMRNYSRRLQGKELRNKVLIYCMQKGFSYEDIIQRLDEMEWE